MSGRATSVMHHRTCRPSLGSTILLAAVASATILLLATAATAASLNRRHLISLRGSLGLLQKKASDASASAITAVPMFPPHSECERSTAQSPFRLSLDQSILPVTSERGLLQRFCFQVNTDGTCDGSSKCCHLASARTISRLEFDVVAGCKDSLQRVTIDGKPAPYEYDTQHGVLRVTGFNASSSLASAESRREVCLYLDPFTSCPSLSYMCARQGSAAAACRYAIFNADASCCPVSLVAATALPKAAATASATVSATTTISAASSSSSVAADTVPAAATTSTVTPWGISRSDFPYCQCQRDAAGSRLFAAPDPSSVTMLPSGLTRICLDVRRRAVCPDPASKCCDFDLYKMEIEIDRACADSLAYTTIDGIQHVRFVQTAPHVTIKVVNLDRHASAAAAGAMISTTPSADTAAAASSSSSNGTAIGRDGSTAVTTVCLFLRSECNSLDKLCAFNEGTCTVGLFSKPSRGASAHCCPLSTVSF